MKKKLLLNIIFWCSLLGLTVGGSILTKAEDKGTDFYWCYKNEKTKPGETSVASIYDNYKTQYDLSAWFDADGNMKKGSCSPDGGNVSCKYSTKTNGKYNLVIESSSGVQYVSPDKNGNIEFTITSAPGDAVSIFSYPKVNNISGTNICKVDDKNQSIAKGDKDRSKYIYTADFNLPNSKKNTFYGSDMCKNLKSAVKGTSFVNYAQSNVPECYDSTSNIDILTTSSDVKGRINEVVNYIKEDSAFSASAKDGSKRTALYCQFDKTNNTTKSSPSGLIKSYKSVENIKDGNSNIWFKMYCTEDMTIEYDMPKSSFAGGGFKYTVKLSSSKICNIKQVRQPVRPTVCRPDYEFTDHNTKFGGPNEDFDKCVNSCDGGQYTSKCSNTCYTKVYENGISSKQIKFTQNEISSLGNVKEMIYHSATVDGDPTWCKTYNDVPTARQNSPSTLSGNWHWQVCPSRETMDERGEKGITVTTDTLEAPQGENLIDSYNGHVYGCVYGWQSDSCSGSLKCTNKCSSSSVETAAQADKKYEDEKAILEGVKADIKKKYKNCKEQSNGSYKCDKEITTKIATENAKIGRQVENKENVLADSAGKVTLDPNISYYTDKSASFINFPHAYISLANGLVSYNNKSSDPTYMFGGYLFYTDVSTTEKTSNDIRYYPYNFDMYKEASLKTDKSSCSVDGVTSNPMKKSGLGYNSKNDTYGNGNHIKWNILTKITGFGSDKQWNIDVNCFYGAMLSTCKPSNGTPSDGGDENGVSGLPYLYRTVNLDDLFPNRESGYNWKNNTANQKASTSNYQINPEALISDIESKGNTIYDGDPYAVINMESTSAYKSSDKYTTFNGSYSKDKDVSFFASSFIKNAASHKQGSDKKNRTN